MALVFALNHMTAPKLSYGELLELSSKLGCEGVEFRNDFAHRTLFDGAAPEDVRAKAQSLGQKIYALSEVKMFNRWSDYKASEAEDLMKIAVAAGIPSVSLIPANDGQGLGNGERQAHLRVALRELKPMLEDYDLIGNVEPLGFPSSSVRSKPELIDAIEAIGTAQFRMVHDTFHHALSGDDEIYPEHTAILHISGVSNQDGAIVDLLDIDRVLVGEDDRLGNLTQIRAFKDAKWEGAFSFEPFAKEIHELDGLEDALRTSMNFINNALSQKAA